MKASEARQLRIEDRVAIHFSNTARIVGVVSRIEWPTFTIALVDAKGRRYHRTRKYNSVYSVRKEDRVRRPHRCNCGRVRVLRLTCLFNA